MLKLLIADDFPLFRRGVKELLADGLGAVTVGECGNAHDLLELVRHKKWDVVILDITMPGSTGTEALKQLKAECPKLPVIVLSMHPEDQYAVRMYRAGADGYLTKAAEKKAIQRQWAKREEQIERVMVATVGMYGDLQGIAGKSLQEIEGLELQAIAPPADATKALTNS